MNVPLRPRRTTLSSRSNSYKDMGDLLVSRRQPSILVVDDNLLNAELLRELLTGRGYQVMTAHTAADAEVEIFREPPDIILLDVVMPGKSGY